MLSTLPSRQRIMIGATPATFTRSGCSTPSAMPAAQPGIDRVAAGFEDREAGGGGEVVAGRNGVTRAVDGRAMGHARQSIAAPADVDGR